MGTNVCIWKLEKSIYDIKDLIKKNYSRTASVDEYGNKLTLNHKWRNGTELKEIFTHDENVIKYFSAEGVIDKITSRKDNLYLNGKILPKDMITDQYKSLVYFVENLESTYAIIVGAKSVETRIKTQLMNDAEKRSESNWGIVENKDVQGYIFGKDFYYWLLHKIGKKLTLEQEHNDITIEVTLHEVNGFSCDGLRKINNYKGEGNGLSKDLPFKSMLSTDKEMVSLRVKALHHSNNITYSFNLHCDGRIDVYINECGEHATMNPQILSLEEIIMTIYFEIIPFLRISYNRGLAEWNEIKNEYKKKVALDAIKDLMRIHDIKLCDINEAVTV